MRAARRSLPWFTAAIGVAAAIAAALVLLPRHDFVPAAVSLAAQPPTLLTAQALTVAHWCSASGAAVPPALLVPQLTIQGARMDSGSGGMMVTVYYTAPQGTRVTVTWLQTSPASSARDEIDTQDVGSRAVLVVHGHSSNVAVITGTAPPDALRRTAAVIASAV